MANDLVAGSALVGFPGSPFGDQVVDSAAATLRRTLGWHVAPQRTETVRAKMPDGGAREELLLPSRHVVEVVAVRHLDRYSGAPTVVDGWRLTDGDEATLRRGGWWPAGEYEVDVVHGYATCPPELLPVLAMLCQELGTDSTVAAWGKGPFSATLRDISGRAGGAGILRFLAASTGL